MKLALIIALAVVVVLLIVLMLVYRGRVVELKRERRRKEEVALELRAAAEAHRQAESVAADLGSRVNTAELHLALAERRAADAERRVSEMEMTARAGTTARVPEIDLTTDMDPAGHTDPAGGDADPAGDVDPTGHAGPSGDVDLSVVASLLSLEEVRMHREWGDLVGPGIPLPVEWDGTLEAAVGTELAIIRETMGAPGRLDSTAGGPDSVGSAGLLDGGRAALGIRLLTELLRLMARDGGEMKVAIDGGNVTVEQETSDDPPSGLDRLVAVAEGAGAGLSVGRGEGKIVVAVRLPDRVGSVDAG